MHEAVPLEQGVAVGPDEAVTGGAPEVALVPGGHQQVVALGFYVQRRVEPGRLRPGDGVPFSDLRQLEIALTPEVRNAFGIEAAQANVPTLSSRIAINPETGALVTSGV